jgi:sugar/nucleoside kinase (ribokinase family)
MSAISCDVVGIGHALVDVLLEVDEGFVAEIGLAKGAMTLMDLDAAERIHARVAARDGERVVPGLERSGGSAANTVAGLALLGARAGFVGRVSDDRLGRVFVDDLHALGVTYAGARSAAGRTGRSLILITPDADRTMCTSLGVAAELAPDDVDDALIAGAQITYLEGYLFDLPLAMAAFRRAIDLAHRAGRRVALSLSDPLCVERHRDEFRALVSASVDIVFGNTEEITALAGVADVVEGWTALRRPGLLLVVTLGPEGAAVVRDDGTVTQAAAVPTVVVDTTGAGDLFAAGFLFGLTRGLDDGRCARLGAIAAAEVISHVGARPEADLIEMVADLS